MEFGKVPHIELDKIDFSLPAEPVANKLVLTGKKVDTPHIYIGGTRWSAAEWRGIIYPEKLKEKDFLQHYVQHFNCIELNATHYKIYGEDTIRKWAASADASDFKFCPKLFKGITHAGSLTGKERETSEFILGLKGFGHKLGPVFIQLSDNFSPSRKEELFTYLRSLPAELQFFLELRHPQWFSNAIVKEELVSFLTEQQIGAVITDTAGRRDCAHMHITVPKIFIRYVGNGMHATDHTRAVQWAERIKYWLDNGMEEIYFMLHMQEETTTPAMAAYMADQLHAICELNIVKPVFIEQNKPVTPAVTNGRLFD